LHWIQPLADITLTDLDRVGSKAAHLGAMLRAGFGVPKGFVIDVNAFISHFGEVTDPLVKPTVPLLQAELMAEVVQALIDNLGAENQVAVRSSSTEEDTSHASFAGQHSTYYFVPPNRIDQAIVDCWMSLWSNAALSYRRGGWAEITSGEPLRMAIIVQKMLPVTRSGVVFSRDPVRSDTTDTVIEACWGLGAALVDGRVSPDHIRVGERDELISYAVSDKQFQVSSEPGNHDAHRLQEVPRHKREVPVLNTEEALKIANIAQQLETLFEEPQDVEWAYVEQELYLLQSRPITTRPLHHDIPNSLVLFKPMAENFTEPLTPLSEDLYAKILPGIGAFYEGRCYLNFDAIKRLNIFKLTDAELVDVMLLRTKPEKPAISWPKVAAGVVFASLAFLADGANWIRTARASPGALARYLKLVEKIRRRPDMSPLDAMRRLVWGQHPFEPIGHQMMYVNVSAGRNFLYIGLLIKLVSRFAPAYPIAELSRTYHGAGDMQSLALLDKLHHLSVSLSQALEEDTPQRDQIAQVLSGEETMLPSDAPFTIEFEDFLHTYGHRGPREMELAAPTWRESPSTLLKILNSNPLSQAKSNAIHGEHLAARDELHRYLKPWQRRLVDWNRRKIGQFISLRENTRHYHIMAFDVVRQKILQVESELLREDKLKVAGDIFYLRHDEMLDLSAERLDPETAHALIRRRRREWQRQARAPLTETINISLPEMTLDEDAMRGQCACPGWVEGNARLIHSLAEADTLLEHEILVAPYTDPAWTPLFGRVAGIVVGTGSFLSHAGTVARELHVPCVVDVKDCMRKIITGQKIRLDATNGQVEIIS